MTNWILTASPNSFLKRPNDVKKLLKYLDGLFEKLPRETLKKFIDSEYFDLYIKVLTELGV